MIFYVKDYAGNYVYENDVLQFFNHPEGYVSPDNSGGFDYVYQYKDHLGNIRLSYTDSDGNGTIAQSEIIEEKNYYPFGLTHKGYNDVTQPTGNSVANRYGYNGKELQDEVVGGSSLDWYDYGARNYDAALGRWMNIDPLAQAYYSKSPFNYALNNPISFIDPDGTRVYFVIYTGGSNDAYDAASTRRKEIENSKGFNSKEDKVYFLNLGGDLGKLKGLIESSVADAEENGFGKTVEASFFGHGAVDGPAGSAEASSDGLDNVTGRPLDANQLSPSEWKSINFNFDGSESIACFYSCNGSEFAERFLNYQNTKFSAGTTGKAGGSYTFKGGFSATWFGFGRKEYMVSEDNGQVNPTAVFSADSPIETYKTGNGQTRKITYKDPEGNIIYSRTETGVQGNPTVDRKTKKVKSGSN